MTTHERVTRMFQHKEADRVPITDWPWQGTLRRWVREGMPAEADWREYLDIDKFEGFHMDVSPRYTKEILEDTPEYTIEKTSFGVTLKQLKKEDATPEFLDFHVNDPARWAEAKARMIPSPDRIDFAKWENNYAKWRKADSWIQGNFWFGFDATHSWMTGTETLLIAMMEDPEWVDDMFEHMLKMNMALYSMLWDRGMKFDSVFWCDDMGYKGTQFFSLNKYREISKKYHKIAIDWAHERGIYAHLHSCGMVEPFIPDLIEIGLDGLNPLEVKAGMNPRGLKAKYGDKLLLHGGVNAVLWDKEEEIEEELRRVVPVLKENGGYIFASDHSIPSSVSLDSMKRIVWLVKELGKY